MATLKEIRTRIASIRSTRKITGAMKMVSASRLRRVQLRIYHLRRFASFLRHLLAEVVQQLPDTFNHPYLRKPSKHSVLVVCIGSNKGLCGTYNALLIKKSLEEINRWRKRDYNVSLLAMGKKPARFLRKYGFEMVPTDHTLIDKVTYGGASWFAHQLSELFDLEGFGRVIVVYNKFKNAVVHQLAVEQLLPLSAKELVEDILGEQPAHESKVILEPATEEVVDRMIREFFTYNLYRIMLDSSASENGSRMTAMHQATDNADEMLKSLSLSYNKARQAAVTRELLDILGGADINHR